MAILQVKQVSSLPKEYLENPVDHNNQPFSKEHDTIVKYPPPQVIYPTIVQSKQFEPYSQKNLEIPLH
jgi:hypothetical protein